MVLNNIIFLDRDGVINIDFGYVYKKEHFIIYPNVIPALQLLSHYNYKFIIVTNQSGIGRKYYTDEDFQNLTNYMLAKFNEYNIKILDIYYCNHHPDANCNCRKPKTGMLEKAINEYNVNIENSWMVGDKESDIEAGNKMNLNTILVLTGNGLRYKNNTRTNFICKDLLDASKLIIIKRK